jgi:diaminohydroxyphosphoribosylaminopyrimidine deaminase/5-amino-6-(5-phosphoribosylamino)uracil reductase
VPDRPVTKEFNVKLENNGLNKSYMKRAIELARLGEGFVNPNPMVGAVIVREGKVIGEGYHKGYGLPHAEADALASCSLDVKGAEIYVTLEPCCHYGTNPPCTKAIIERGISKVYVGSLDPNPKVCGQGVQILRDHGIEVITGVLEEECDALNQVFFHYIQNNTPYIIMKYAMTMDGKIAAANRESKWITGEVARQRVHLDRHRYMGIMVGVGTVLKDNPSLDSRHIRGTQESVDNAIRNPIRIICDTNLRTPVTAKVVTTAIRQPTIIATANDDKERWKSYQEMGCEVLLLPKSSNGIDVKELIIKLGAGGIDSVILEGGSALNWSFVEAGLVNRVQCYIAPKIFGGAKAISPIGGIGIDSPNNCLHLSPPKIEILGDDILLESEVLSCSQE